MTNGTNDLPATQPAGKRMVIQATCTLHGGCRGFTNLAVSKLGGEIVLDPHAVGAGVITLDDAAAIVLRDLLLEWLG